MGLEGGRLTAEHQFTARIGIAGINPFVDVPMRIASALGGPGFIPVSMTIDGHPFSANLVPLGKGRFRLYLNGPMRKAARKDVGDRVKIGLARDNAPRAEPVRAEFAMALAANPVAAAAFEALSPSGRKEILRYLNRLKRPESVARTAERVIRQLNGAPPAAGTAFMRPRGGKAK